jgi:uncharacterized protein
MNALPEFLNPNSALPCPGGVQTQVPKPSKPDKKLMTVPGCLRISGFGFLSDFGFRISDLLSLLLVLALCAGITGCSFLKPAQSTTRHYVLTATPATGPAAAAATPLAVGLGQVKLPAYLFDTSLAVRKGTNEIVYLPSAQWAERLDTGFQRVLAANLALLLPSDRIRLSAWRSDEVAAELYVAIEQFDVDASGRGVLVAQWRVLAPAGEKTLKTGTSRLSRQGPPPDTGASGAVATLSELVTDFSRQLAQTLQESTSGQAGPVSR